MVIVNDTVVTIAPEYSQACITLEAYDDAIVEGTETFVIVAYPSNMLDRVDGNTTVYVTDNDGTFGCRLRNGMPI